MMKSAYCAMLATAVLLTASPAVNAGPKLLVKNLEGASGSTIGPRGDLFVTEGAAGRISRVDPKTGKSGALPPVSRNPSSASAARLTSSSSITQLTYW